MLGANVNAARAVAAVLSRGALLLRLGLPIAAGDAIVVAGLVRIAVIHQAALGAVICR